MTYLYAGIIEVTMRKLVHAARAALTRVCLATVCLCFAISAVSPLTAPYLGVASAKNGFTSCSPDGDECAWAHCGPLCSVGFNRTSNFMSPKLDLYTWDRKSAIGIDGGRGASHSTTLGPGECKNLSHWPQWPWRSRICARIEMLSRYGSKEVMNPDGKPYENAMMCAWNDPEDFTDGFLVGGSASRSYFPYNTSKKDLEYINAFTEGVSSPIGMGLMFSGGALVLLAGIITSLAYDHMNHSTGKRIKKWRNPFLFPGRGTYPAVTGVKDDKESVSCDIDNVNGCADVVSSALERDGTSNYDRQAFGPLKNRHLFRVEVGASDQHGSGRDLEWGERESARVMTELQLDFGILGSIDIPIPVRRELRGQVWTNAEDRNTYNELKQGLAPGCVPVPLGPFPPPWGARAFFPMPMAALPVPIIHMDATYLVPQVKLLWCMENGKETMCTSSQDIKEAEIGIGKFIETPAAFRTEEISLGQVSDTLKDETGIAFYNGNETFSVRQEMPAMIQGFGGSVAGITAGGAPAGLAADPTVELTFEAEVPVDKPDEICVYYTYSGVGRTLGTPAPGARFPLANPNYEGGHCIPRPASRPMPHIQKLDFDEVPDERMCVDNVVPGVKLKIPTTEENEDQLVTFEDDIDILLDGISVLDIDGGDQCLSDMRDMFNALPYDTSYSMMRRCMNFSYSDGSTSGGGGPDESAAGEATCNVFDAVSCLQGYASPLKVAVDGSGSVLQDKPNVKIDGLPSAYRYLPPDCVSTAGQGKCDNYVTGCYSWKKGAGCVSYDNHISSDYYAYTQNPDTGALQDISGACARFSGSASSSDRKCLAYKSNVNYDDFSPDLGISSLMTLPPDQVGLCEKVDGNLYFGVGNLNRTTGAGRRLPGNRREALGLILDKAAYNCSSMCVRDPCNTVECEYTGKIASSYMCYTQPTGDDTDRLFNRERDASQGGSTAGCDINMANMDGVDADDKTDVMTSVTIPPQGTGREREEVIFTANTLKECQYVLIQAWGGGARGAEKRSGGGGAYAEMILDAAQLADKKLQIFTGDGGMNQSATPRKNYYRHNVPVALDDTDAEFTMESLPPAQTGEETPAEAALMSIQAKIRADGQDTVILIENELLLIAEGGMAPTAFDISTNVSRQAAEVPPGGRVFFNTDAGGAGSGLIKRAYMAEGGRGSLADNAPRDVVGLSENSINSEAVGYSSKMSFYDGAKIAPITAVEGGASGPFYTEIMGTAAQRTTANAKACYDRFCSACTPDKGADNIAAIYTQQQLNDGVVSSPPTELCTNDYLVGQDVSDPAAPATGASEPADVKWAIYPYGPGSGANALCAGEGLSVDAGVANDNNPDYYAFENILNGRPTYGAGGCAIDNIVGGEGWPGAVAMHCIRDLNDDMQLIDEDGTAAGGDSIPITEVDFSDVLTKISENNRFIHPGDVDGAETTCGELNVLLRRYDRTLFKMVYYDCELTNTLHGQFAESLSLCTPIDNPTGNEVTYEVIPQRDPSDLIHGFEDIGEKKAGGKSFTAHGVWRLYPQPPLCDAGEWRF